MKKIILLITMMLGVLYANPTVETCKASIKMAQNYKATMGDDILSIKTMQAYKNNVIAHCGTLTAAEPSPTAALLAKQDQVMACQASISRAQIFKEEMSNSKEDQLKLQAHKCLVVQSCGTITAAFEVKPVLYCSL